MSFKINLTDLGFDRDSAEKVTVGGDHILTSNQKSFSVHLQIDARTSQKAELIGFALILGILIFGTYAHSREFSNTTSIYAGGKFSNATTVYPEFDQGLKSVVEHVNLLALMNFL